MAGIGDSTGPQKDGLSDQVKEPLLIAEHVCKDFQTGRHQTLHAVTDVSFTIYRGETLALVGESGCGKSTLGRTLIRMLPATSGTVIFDGQCITRMNAREFRPVRKRMQMVFQDPYASLDPRMKVRDIIAEPLITHKVCGGRRAVTDRVLQLMEMTGVPAEYLNRYPHQFSGGQRQRIGIARAIALSPDLLVCDEPVSALDVSVQSQVLNLLKKLKTELKLTNLFIGHDLSVINFIADRVCVMFLGKLCEIAPRDELYNTPLHPYTEFLLDAIPQADPHLRGGHRKILTGEIPSPVNPPSGCYFRTRCPYADQVCAEKAPEMADYGNGHQCACHHPRGTAPHSGKREERVEESISAEGRTRE